MTEQSGDCLQDIPMQSIGGELDEEAEQRFVESHGHVNEITVGTMLEFDDWQWTVISDIAVDRNEPKFGFVLMDNVNDDLIKLAEEAVGCRQHYEVIKHLCGGKHEYWAPVEYVVEADIWNVLGPVHPDFRSGNSGRNQ